MPDKQLYKIGAQLRSSGLPRTILGHHSFVHGPFAGAQSAATESKLRMSFRDSEQGMVDSRHAVKVAARGMVISYGKGLGYVF
jgi:hypothetical protein